MSLQTLLGSRHTTPQLLVSNYTTPGLLDPARAGSFPNALLQPSVSDARLPADVHCQVVDIEDVSRSRWEQVEELERMERGESQVGRAVVQVVQDEDGDQDGGGSSYPQQQQQQQQGPATRTKKKNATHRIVLQDCTGRMVYALELDRLPRLGVGTTKIGEKIMVKRGAAVARGMLLLEQTTCTFYGGQIEALQKVWASERLKTLRKAVGAGDRPGGGGQ